MTTRKLDEQEWHRYFDEGDRALHGLKATVEVVGADIGAQFVAEGLGIFGITYDQKGKLLEVVLDGMEHLILYPREIYVDETPQGLAVVEATDADGRKHIIQIARQ